MKGCATCGWGELTYPPSPGGPTDGVNCSNPDHVAYCESCGMESILEEFEEYGHVNLFTYESVSDEDCPNWKQKEEVTHGTDIRVRRT